MKKILITGGKGFIGQHLQYQLNNCGYEITCIQSKEYDLTKPETLQKLLNLEFDFIFHLAGRVDAALSWVDPVDFYQVNYLTVLHILEYARLKKIPLHYVSSYVYGYQTKQPISESLIPKPNNPYAHSKWLAEELCLFYHQHFNVALTIGRPFNIYGTKQSTKFFIPNLIQQIKNHSHIMVNDLTPKRDYIYIDDVAAALIAIMKYGKNGEIYNIGTGVSYSCLEVINILQSILKTNKKILSCEQARRNEIPDTRADTLKIQKHTGWQARYSLQAGLRKMLL